MKRKSHLFIVFISLIGFLTACDRPECKNSNPIFNQYPPQSNEYKAELVKQLGVIDKSELTYWFKEFVETNGQENLLFNIQGDGLCAELFLDVETWGKLEELRRMKGVTYRGAKFINLKFDIQEDTSNIKFIYRGFTTIID